jgi:hypothetical protein
MQADTVIVNATDGDDAIVLDDSAAGVVVSGLAARVTITGADAAPDLLAVNGLGGADTINASGLPAGLK